MIELYIWGAGHIADEALSGAEKNIPTYLNNDIFVIRGIIDNDSSRYGNKFHGYEIVSPGQAIERGFDYITILIENEWDANIQAVYGYRIAKKKVKDKYFFLKLLLSVKYKMSTNPDIVQTIDYWNNNDISMYNQFLEPTRKYHPVIWDKSINLPYIIFEDVLGKKKKMYFPRNYQFIRKNGRQLIEDVLWEQQVRSPHLYTYKGHDVRDGDVIIDGGVCEGNFALRYAEVASKLYLFESDYWWSEANYYTFKDFGEKIKYYPLALSHRNDKKLISLDNVFGLNNRVDFIKLDIEGNEVSALFGAEKTLKNNNARLSVCSYHNMDDEKLIKEQLQRYGYKTSTSEGIVVFLWDLNIWWNLDFRKGIVYGDK